MYSDLGDRDLTDSRAGLWEAGGRAQPAGGLLATGVRNVPAGVGGGLCADFSTSAQSRVGFRGSLGHAGL